MARISTSSSGGNVNIQDTNGNPITATGGALNVNATISGNEGFSNLTPGTPTQIAVGTSSTTLLIANPNRKYAHIINNSGNTIYIQYSVSAALNQGIKLPGFGSIYTIESSNLWLGEINAIGLIAGQLIDILEGIL